MNKRSTIEDVGMESRARATAVAKCHDESHNRHMWMKAISLFFAIALVALYAITASGQAPANGGIKFDPRWDDPATKKSMESAAKSYASTQDLSALDAMKLRMAATYYRYYIPGKIVRPDGVGEISNLVWGAHKNLDRAVRGGAPGAGQMASWLFDGLVPVARGNYPPVARVAALMFLGRFDKGSVNGVPVPDERVFPHLLLTYRDAKAPDAVRAAALKGLDRFAKFTPANRIGPPNAKNALIGDMNALLASEPPAGRDPAVHAYLQRFAVNILNNVKPDVTLAKTLVSVASKEESPDLLALHSAEAIGKADPALLKGTVADPDAILKGWAKRAAENVQAEIDRMDAKFGKGKKNKEQIRQDKDPREYLSPKEEKVTKKRNSRMMMGGEEEMMMQDSMMEGADMDMDMDMGSGMEEMMMMGGPMMGGFGSTTVKEQPPEVVVSKKRLNAVFQQIHIGVTGSEKLGIPRTPSGLLVAVPDDKKKVVEDWEASFKGIVEAINDKGLGTENDYIESLTTNLELLKELAGIEEEAEAAGEDVPIPTLDGFDGLLGG